MAERVVRWFVFSVVLALLPLAFRFAWQSTSSNTPTVANILSQGELLLVSAAIAAAAVGELVARGRQSPIMQILACGGCIGSVLFSSLYYAVVSTHHSQTPIFESTVSSISFWMFGLTVVSSAGCISLAETEK